MFARTTGLQLPDALNSPRLQGLIERGDEGWPRQRRLCKGLEASPRPEIATRGEGATQVRLTQVMGLQEFQMPIHCSQRTALRYNSGGQ
jgi:hypothetical protein